MIYLSINNFFVYFNVFQNKISHFLSFSLIPFFLFFYLQLRRYEIKDILPPPAVRTAMEMQAEAERRKRAAVLASEGESQSKINVAEARKQEVILASEAAREDQINRATGEAEAIFRRAEATSKGIEMLAESIRQTGGNEAVSLRVAEQYLAAFGEIAKKGTTMLLPSSASDPATMVAQALGIYGNVMGGKTGGGGGAPGLPGGGGGGGEGVKVSAGRGEAADQNNGRRSSSSSPQRPSTPEAHRQDASRVEKMSAARPAFSLQRQ